VPHLHTTISQGEVSWLQADHIEKHSDVNDVCDLVIDQVIIDPIVWEHGADTLLWSLESLSAVL